MISAGAIKDHILKKSIEAMEKPKNDLQAPEVIDVSCTVSSKKIRTRFLFF